MMAMALKAPVTRATVIMNRIGVARHIECFTRLPRIEEMILWRRTVLYAHRE
jgi:hypothetical protein